MCIRDRFQFYHDTEALYGSLSEVGALTGGFTAAAGGVTASLTAGFLAALRGKSRDQS